MSAAASAARGRCTTTLYLPMASLIATLDAAALLAPSIAITRAPAIALLGWVASKIWPVMSVSGKQAGSPPVTGSHDWPVLHDPVLVGSQALLSEPPPPQPARRMPVTIATSTDVDVVMARRY